METGWSCTEEDTEEDKECSTHLYMSDELAWSPGTRKLITPSTRVLVLSSLRKYV